MEKKNLIDQAVAYQIWNNPGESLEALNQLGLVKQYKHYKLSHSDAFCWIEREPNKKDKKEFLRQMGYEF
jgi:hypothetical protein